MDRLDELLIKIGDLPERLAAILSQRQATSASGIEGATRVALTGAAVRLAEIAQRMERLSTGADNSGDDSPSAPSTRRQPLQPALERLGFSLGGPLAQLASVARRTRNVLDNWEDVRRAWRGPDKMAESPSAVPPPPAPWPANVPRVFLGGRVEWPADHPPSVPAGLPLPAGGLLDLGRQRAEAATSLPGSVPATTQPMTASRGVGGAPPDATAGQPIVPAAPPAQGATLSGSGSPLPTAPAGGGQGRPLTLADLPEFRPQQGRSVPSPPTTTPIAGGIPFGIPYTIPSPASVTQEGTNWPSAVPGAVAGPSQAVPPGGSGQPAVPAGSLTQAATLPTSLPASLPVALPSAVPPPGPSSVFSVSGSVGEAAGGSAVVEAVYGLAKEIRELKEKIGKLDIDINPNDTESAETVGDDRRPELTLRSAPAREAREEATPPADPVRAEPYRIPPGGFRPAEDVPKDGDGGIGGVLRGLAGLLGL